MCLQACISDRSSSGNYAEACPMVASNSAAPKYCNGNTDRSWDLCPICRICMAEDQGSAVEGPCLGKAMESPQCNYLSVNGITVHVAQSMPHSCTCNARRRCPLQTHRGKAAAQAPFSPTLPAKIRSNMANSLTQCLGASHGKLVHGSDRSERLQKQVAKV